MMNNRARDVMGKCSRIISRDCHKIGHGCPVDQPWHIGLFDASAVLVHYIYLQRLQISVLLFVF